MIKRRVLCIVMDGIGVRSSKFGNAVELADAPTIQALKLSPFYRTLKAHGKAVGLPSDEDIGNSEVGHNALGAGRVFSQGAKLVNEAIASGSLFKGEVWQGICKFVTQKKSTLHFLGLLSDGNVHSHESHLHALIKQAKDSGINRVRIHALLDGRDVSEKSAEVYISRLEAFISKLRSPTFDVALASGGGRMKITMDRYNADWPMVERGWNVHVHGKGETFNSFSEAIAKFREDPSLTDQNLPGFVVADKSGEAIGKIRDGDGVILFNFRGDRAIEISRAFTEPDFKLFPRGKALDCYFAGMMEYDGDLHIPPKYLVNPPAIDHPLSEYLESFSVKQFACSETQKFGHVTFFWNGNKSGYINPAHEEYLEIPSDPADLFAKQPKMKAKEIADATIQRMRKHSFDFGRINFANGDMVGHTGDLKAAIQAIEEVDRQINRLIEAAKETGTVLIITADHGNADEMFEGKESDFPQWEEAGGKKPKPKTSHTLAPVPFVVYGVSEQEFKLAQIPDGSLAHVANTIITLLGLPVNTRYEPSLITPA